MSPFFDFADTTPELVVVQFVLMLLRTGGLVVFCPIFGAEILPARIRVGLALVLTLAVLTVAPPVESIPAGIGAWILLGVRELAVGLSLGLAARALFAGIESAAGLVAGQSGFALASMIDPLTGDTGASTMLFQNLAAVALFLAADLHHVFLRGLRDSYALLPPAAALPELSGMHEATALLGARLFQIAVELAAPALIVTFAVDLVLILVGRALPQVQVLTVGYPLKMAAGIVGLAVLLSATGTAMGFLGRTFASDASTLLAAFAGRGAR
jgi:flagellar biosynthesis protein FliR